MKAPNNTLKSNSLSQKISTGHYLITKTAVIFIDAYYICIFKLGFLLYSKVLSLITSQKPNETTNHKV